MSSNPYAHPEPFDTGPPGYDEPQRVSGIAVASLIFSLICCIPGVSLIGALLGGIAIVRISQARGRLSGRGLAVAGLVIGLLITMLWLGAVLGLGLFLSHLDVYGQTLRALDQRDYNAVRQALTPTAAAAATDQRLEEFRAQVETDWGSYQRIPRGLAEWGGSYLRVGELIVQHQQTMQRMPGEPLAMPVFYDNGLTLVFFLIDPRSPAPTGAAQISNFAIFDRQDAPMWLIPLGAPPPPPPPPPPPQQTPEPVAPPADPTAPPHVPEPSPEDPRTPPEEAPDPGPS